jgi:acyl transferase domain-containing protein
LFGGFSHNEIDRNLTASELVTIGDNEQIETETFELFHRQLGCHWLAYLFDLKGPFYDYESACSSALTGLVDAYHALASGRLDMALICSANLNLSPHLQLQYVR